MYLMTVRLESKSRKGQVDKRDKETNKYIPYLDTYEKYTRALFHQYGTDLSAAITGVEVTFGPSAGLQPLLLRVENHGGTTARGLL